jgi:hypothetical protein
MSHTFETCQAHIATYAGITETLTLKAGKPSLFSPQNKGDMIALQQALVYSPSFHIAKYMPHILHNYGISNRKKSLKSLAYSKT